MNKAPMLYMLGIKEQAMIVLTADQIDSRHQRDLAEPTLRRLDELIGTRLARPAERTAGDEIQLATTDADAAQIGRASCRERV